MTDVRNAAKDGVQFHIHQKTKCSASQFSVTKCFANKKHLNKPCNQRSINLFMNCW